MQVIYSTLLVLLLLPAAQKLSAQNGRISDANSFGWYNTFLTTKVSDKYSLYLETNFRRQPLLRNWQQGLVRVGLQREWKNGVSVMAGYAFQNTWPFGSYPSTRFSFPEHRLHQQLTWRDQINKTSLQHRIRLEQRFAGQLDTGMQKEITTWRYTNRIRYQLRALFPLKGKTIDNNEYYLMVYDEIMLSFGKNVGVNVYDQNRLGLLIGYKLNNKLRAEAGYLNQVSQQGRLVNNSAVFLYNHIFILNFHINIDASQLFEN